MMLSLMNLVVLFCAMADVNLTEESLLKFYPTEPLLNEIIAFETVPAHKFNLEAKNTCGNGRMLVSNEHLIECQMYAPGTATLELYICDDKKTYCRREVISVKTQSPKGIGGWFKYYKGALEKKDAWSTPYRTGVSIDPLARGFVSGDFEKIKTQAKKEKKNILVYFSQLACGPCRMLKELSFPSDEFQEITKDFIRYQADIDIDIHEDLRDLKIQGTPTVVVLNKEGQELDRRSFVASPATYQKWFASIPTVPIDAIKDKPLEPASKFLSAQLTKTLDDDERFRLSRWYDEKGGKGEKSLELLKSIKNKTPLVNYWTDLHLATEAKSSAESLATFKKITPAQISLGPLAYKDTVTSLIYQTANGSDKKLLEQILAFVESTAKNVVDEDPLQKAINQYDFDSALLYGYRKIPNAKEEKKWQAKVADDLDKVPHLSGVKDTPYVNLMKANVLEDAAAKEQIMGRLREENKNDYAYDYLEASRAFNDKKYDQALQLVDKSLLVAKDRSWQKAFLLKLEILRTLNRGPEAVALIEGLLKDMQLPESTSMKVHGFMQSLRKEQGANQKPTVAAPAVGS